MSLNCEICKELTDFLSPDKKNVICSLPCLSELRYRASKPKAETTLNVQGRGVIKVTPDRVRITIVVIRQAPQISKTNQLLIEASDALLKTLENKVEKLQTLNLSIEPIREKSKEKDREGGYVYHPDNQGKIIEYEGRFPISFETIISNAGPIEQLGNKWRYPQKLDLSYNNKDLSSNNRHLSADK